MAHGEKNNREQRRPTAVSILGRKKTKKVKVWVPSQKTAKGAFIKAKTENDPVIIESIYLIYCRCSKKPQGSGSREKTATNKVAMLQIRSEGGDHESCHQKKISDALESE